MIPAEVGTLFLEEADSDVHSSQGIPPADFTAFVNEAQIRISFFFLSGAQERLLGEGKILVKGENMP